MFVDTAPLIYLVERHPKYIALVRPFFQALTQGEVRGVTSTLTLAEVLVQPFKLGNQHLAGEYRSILVNSIGMELVGVTHEIAEAAAAIRAKYAVKTPDAIQLAVAMEFRASIFLTNDFGMPRLAGLRRVVLDEVLAAP